jgi:magnesium chelatase subunit I
VLETVLSNAERRTLVAGEALVVPRVSDIYAALPSITGKIELEYEGELKGAEHVGRELIRAAVASVFDARASRLNTKPIVTWFENGGTIDLSDTISSDALLDAVGGIDRFDEALGLVDGTGFEAPLRAAAADFILEGLCALRKIGRTEGGQLFASPPAPATRDPRKEVRSLEQLMEDDEEEPRGRKKKYFN